MYPIHLDIAGRSCVVIGGGQVALRKVRSLLREKAQVTVIAPSVLPEIATQAREGRLTLRERAYQTGDAQGAFLMFCAADDAEANRKAADEAKQCGALVNAASAPERCDFIVPASLRRGDLLISISTGGQSPEMARVLRQKLEDEFGDGFGEWLKRLGKLRRELKSSIGDSRSRQAFWRLALGENILDFIKNGQIDAAEMEVKHAVRRFGAEPQDSARGGEGTLCHTEGSHPPGIAESS